MADNSNPGDVELGDIRIEGKDVSQHFVSMLFQEHLFSPMVRSHIRLNQYSGMQSDFDGSHESTISFGTPNGMRRNYALGTNSIGTVTTNGNDRARNFMVELVSKHALVNNSTPNYQKSFKNMQISSVIQSILKDGLGLSIPLNLSQTRGIQGSDYQPIILTQKSPLRHIDDLRRMAVSLQNNDGFLMFSGIGSSGGEEFNFKSLFDLLQNDVVAKLTNMTKFEMNSSVATTMMNNAIELFYPKQTDALAKGASFSDGTTMYDVNKASGNVPQTPTGPARQQAISSTSLNPGQVSGFVHNPYNGMPGTGNVVLEDSRRPDTRRAQTAAHTQALFADMMQNALTVKIPGNSNLKIGDIVDFDMREQTDSFANKDTKFSGKNLIAGISHYVGPVGDRPRYVTYVDLVNIQTVNGKVS